MEIVVKVGSFAGVPREGPADFVLPGVELSKRGSGDNDHGGVTRAEVAKVGDVFACRPGISRYVDMAWMDLERKAGRREKCATYQQRHTHYIHVQHQAQT